MTPSPLKGSAANSFKFKKSFVIMRSTPHFCLLPNAVLSRPVATASCSSSSDWGLLLRARKKILYNFNIANNFHDRQALNLRRDYSLLVPQNLSPLLVPSISLAHLD